MSQVEKLDESPEKVEPQKVEEDKKSIVEDKEDIKAPIEEKREVEASPSQDKDKLKQDDIVEPEQK